MSKNTASHKFRRVDVDAFDPDKFNEETVEGEDQGPSEQEVNTLLTQYPFLVFPVSLTGSKSRVI